MFLLKKLRHFYFARTGHYYFAVTIKTSHNLYYVKPRPKLDMFIWRRSSMRPQSTPTSFRGVLRHHWGVFSKSAEKDQIDGALIYVAAAFGTFWPAIFASAVNVIRSA